jgi:hypothetical protein
LHREPPRVLTRIQQTLYGRYTFGLDESLWPTRSWRPSSPTAASETCRHRGTRHPYATTLTSAVDPGPDGFVGTADDSTFGLPAHLFGKPNRHE